MQRGGKVCSVAKGKLTNGKDLSGATAGACIFHRREKGGVLAALSNCIPTFGEGKGRDGQTREWEET